MPTLNPIAVAGATGSLGPPLVKALVAAKFAVTILSQSGNTSSLPDGVKTAKVDYASHDSLVAALKGHQALVSLIPDHGGQAPLIDAAIAAGVERYIPSEFGSNVSGNALTSALPVFKGKNAAQAYLNQKRGQISWTIVVNSGFLDWGLNNGFLTNMRGGKTKIWGDPKVKHSFSTLADVAQGVVGILQHPAETKDRTVYVQSIATSQDEILGILQKQKPDLKIEREPQDMDTMMAENHALLAKGGANIKPAMIGFIITSIFDPKYGNNWDEKNDNELLGVKGIDRKGLEELIASL